MQKDKQQLPTDNFSHWLAEAKASVKTGKSVNVSCGDCTACCRSSQFIHIRRNETKTLGKIPSELLFPAPGEPLGNMLMSYNEHGQCPMLVDNTCSIYAHRPNTCRTYDCRIFPAAGIDETESEVPLIAKQANRWKFSFASAEDHDKFSSVQEAAAFLRQHPECFASGSPSNSTQLAVMAIRVHAVFDRLRDDRRKTGNTPEDATIVAAIIEESKKISS